MPKFRKKPVAIEAWQFKANTGEAMPDWLRVAVASNIVRFAGDAYPYAEIVTLEGTMIASPDDWIIKGVTGELYPCKPHIFAATYDAAD